MCKVSLALSSPIPVTGAHSANCDSFKVQCKLPEHWLESLSWIPWMHLDIPFNSTYIFLKHRVIDLSRRLVSKLVLKTKRNVVLNALKKCLWFSRQLFVFEFSLNHLKELKIIFFYINTFSWYINYYNIQILNMKIVFLLWFLRKAAGRSLGEVGDAIMII